MIAKAQMSTGTWAVLWSAGILAEFATEHEADAYIEGMQRRVVGVGG